VKSRSPRPRKAAEGRDGVGERVVEKRKGREGGRLFGSGSVSREEGGNPHRVEKRGELSMARGA
jgi:hypothetical protein